MRENGSLYYFAAQQEAASPDWEAAKGVIPLQGAEVAADLGIAARKAKKGKQKEPEYGFSIHTANDGPVYYVRCPDPETLEQWLQALDLAQSITTESHFGLDDLRAESNAEIAGMAVYDPVVFQDPIEAVVAATTLSDQDFGKPEEGFQAQFDRLLGC